MGFHRVSLAVAHGVYVRVCPAVRLTRGVFDSMIRGLGSCGRCGEAVRVFESMRRMVRGERRGSLTLPQPLAGRVCARTHVFMLFAASWALMCLTLSPEVAVLSILCSPLLAFMCCFARIVWE